MSFVSYGVLHHGKKTKNGKDRVHFADKMGPAHGDPTLHIIKFVIGLTVYLFCETVLACWTHVVENPRREQRSHPAEQDIEAYNRLKPNLNPFRCDYMTLSKFVIFAHSCLTHQSRGECWGIESKVLVAKSTLTIELRRYSKRYGQNEMELRKRRAEALKPTTNKSAAKGISYKKLQTTFIITLLFTQLFVAISRMEVSSGSGDATRSPQLRGHWSDDHVASMYLSAHSRCMQSKLFNNKRHSTQNTPASPAVPDLLSGVTFRTTARTQEIHGRRPPRSARRPERPTATTTRDITDSARTPVESAGDYRAADLWLTTLHYIKGSIARHDRHSRHKENGETHDVTSNRQGDRGTINVLYPPSTLVTYHRHGSATKHIFKSLRVLRSRL